MALPHAHSGQLVDVRPLGPKLADTTSRAILKTNHVELMRLVLQKGKSLPDHQVPGEVTILCLEGRVELEVHGQRQAMQAGDMVYLAGGQPHAVHAIGDASVLMTILLTPHQATAPADAASRGKTLA